MVDFFQMLWMVLVGLTLGIALVGVVAIFAVVIWLWVMFVSKTVGWILSSICSRVKSCGFGGF